MGGLNCKVCLRDTTNDKQIIKDSNNMQMFLIEENEEPRYNPSMISAAKSECVSFSKSGQKEVNKRLDFEAENVLNGGGENVLFGENGGEDIDESQRKNFKQIDNGNENVLKSGLKGLPVEIQTRPTIEMKTEVEEVKPAEVTPIVRQKSEIKVVTKPVEVNKVQEEVVDTMGPIETEVIGDLNEKIEKLKRVQTNTPPEDKGIIFVIKIMYRLLLTSFK